MNAQSTENAPKILKETKNKIKVDFERSNAWIRYGQKYFSWTAIGKAVWWIFRFVILIGVSYVILQPFYAKISSSFMSIEDIADATVKMIPKYPNLDIYKAILTENDYFEGLFNTTMLALICAICQTMICSLIGYGLAKFKFRGKGIVFAIVIFSMIVPHGTLRLAMYLKFRYFDVYGIINFLGGGLVEGFKILNTTNIMLTGSFWPLIILSLTGLGFKNGLYIFMMRQFFNGVPDELEESAYIDGASTFRTFVQVIMPLSIPMMITVFLFSFCWQFTDNFYVDVFFPLNKITFLPDTVLIPKSLSDIAGAAQNLYNSAITNACSLLIVIPLLIVYLFCQRYLVQGIERSGIVG